MPTKNIRISPMQEGLLYHCFASKDGSLYKVFACLRFEVEVDHGLFSQAWQRCVDRHSILRSSFHWPEGGPSYQCIHETVEAPCNLTDLSKCSREECTRMLERTHDDILYRPFDPSVAPLASVDLVKLGKDTFCAFVSIHHAIIDGASFALLLAELLETYEALGAGRDPELNAPCPFSHYLAWLDKRDPLSGQGYLEEIYEQHEGGPPLVESLVGTVCREPAERHGTIEAALSQHNTLQLQEFVRDQQYTVNNVIQLAWTLTLSKLQGTSELMFGGVRASRRSLPEALREVMGPVISTLPLRIDLAKDRSVQSCLVDLREQWVNLRELEHLSPQMAGDVSRAHTADESLSSIVCFETSTMSQAIAALVPSAKATLTELVSRTHYPLVLTAYEGTSLDLQLDYDRRHCDDLAAKALINSMTTLLEGICTDPTQQLEALSLLNEDQSTWLHSVAIGPRQAVRKLCT